MKSPVCSACRKNPTIAGASLCPTCMIAVQEHRKEGSAVQAQVRAQLSEKRAAFETKYLPNDEAPAFKPFEDRERDKYRSHFANDSDHGRFLAGTDSVGAVVYAVRALLTYAQSLGVEPDEIVSQARETMEAAANADELYKKHGSRKTMLDNAKVFVAEQAERKQKKREKK